MTKQSRSDKSHTKIASPDLRRDRNDRKRIMNSTSQTVAKILLRLHAVSLNPQIPFKYDSGILSPVYIDNRILISCPKERKIIRDLYIDAIKLTGEKFELIAATATAGIPHAAWIADKLNLPMVYVRGKAKDHGKRNRVEGVVKKGAKTVVIEDLISTGESAIETVQAVREIGGEVNYIISIVTYEMTKSLENFKNNKIKLVSLTTFTDIVTFSQDIGQISEKESKIILDWAQNPTAWGKKMGFE